MVSQSRPIGVDLWKAVHFAKEFSIFPKLCEWGEAPLNSIVQLCTRRKHHFCFTLTQDILCRVNFTTFIKIWINSLRKWTAYLLSINQLHCVLLKINSTQISLMLHLCLINLNGRCKTRNTVYSATSSVFSIAIYDER